MLEKIIKFDHRHKAEQDTLCVNNLLKKLRNFSLSANLYPLRPIIITLPLP